MAQIEQSVRCVCLCVCSMTFERNDHWPRYLACWFVLTLSKVKVIGCRSQPQNELEEASAHKSAKTHAGTIFVTRYLDLWLLIPKNEFQRLIVKHMYVKFDVASCIGFWDIERKQTDTQTNGGENRTRVTAVGVGNRNIPLLAHMHDITWRVLFFIELFVLKWSVRPPVRAFDVVAHLLSSSLHESNIIDAVFSSKT